MDKHDLDLPAQAGSTRRQVLRVGAVGGAVLWTAPAVQVLAVTPASAAEPSPQEPKPCDQTALASTAGRGTIVFGAGVLGPLTTEEARTDEAGDGTSSAGTGPTTVQPGLPVVQLTATTARATSESDVNAARATSYATSTIEDFELRFPTGIPTQPEVRVAAKALIATARATTTAAGASSRTSTAQVLGLTVNQQSVVLPPGDGPGTVEVPVVVGLTPVALVRFEYRQRPPDATGVPSPAIEVTSTALTITIFVLGEQRQTIVLSQAFARSAFPACPVKP